MNKDDDEKPESDHSSEEDTTEESDEVATTTIPNDVSNEEDDSFEDTTEVLVSNDIDEELESLSELETATEQVLEEDNSEEDVDDLDSVATTTDIPEVEITTFTPMGAENEDDKEELDASTEHEVIEVTTDPNINDENDNATDLPDEVEGVTTDASAIDELIDGNDENDEITTFAPEDTISEQEETDTTLVEITTTAKTEPEPAVEADEPTTEDLQMISEEVESTTELPSEEDAQETTTDSSSPDESIVQDTTTVKPEVDDNESATTVNDTTDEESETETDTFTTEPIKENDRFEDEILDDDVDAYYEEDFGVVVKPASEDEDYIDDPLDDIADHQEISQKVPHDIEFVEIPDKSETSNRVNDDLENEVTTVQGYKFEFDHTTIAFPFESDVVENNGEVTTQNPFVLEFEPVVAEDENEKRPGAVDSAGLFLETTTGTPDDNDFIAENPVFEAVIAEEEDEARPSVTDAEGLFIDTTTGSANILLKKAAETKPLNKVQVVAETVEKIKIVENGQLKNVQELEKQARAKDEDVIEADFQSLSTDSPADLIVNITDPSDKPGSILTTLIDGFLLPKQPIQESDKTVNIAIKESEQVTEGGFPVTNILSGIYNLVSSVSSYIKEDDDENVEHVTAIPENAINVHNMPRDQLIVQAANAENEDIPSEPLPLAFLRGVPTDNKPRPQTIDGPVLLLNEEGNERDPVNIDLKERLISPRSLEFDPKETIRSAHFIKFLQDQPLHFRKQFLSRQKRDSNDEHVEEIDNFDCSWRIKVSSSQCGKFRNISVTQILREL